MSPLRTIIWGISLFTRRSRVPESTMEPTVYDSELGTSGNPGVSVPASASELVTRILLLNGCVMSTHLKRLIGTRITQNSSFRVWVAWGGQKRSRGEGGQPKPGEKMEASPHRFFALYGQGRNVCLSQGPVTLIMIWRWMWLFPFVWAASYDYRACCVKKENNLIL